MESLSATTRYTQILVIWPLFLTTWNLTSFTAGKSLLRVSLIAPGPPKIGFLLISVESADKDFYYLYRTLHFCHKITGLKSHRINKFYTHGRGEDYTRHVY